MLKLNDGRNELWQWDTGRKLNVGVECSQVHFSNKVFGRSIDVDVVDGIAIIPDILLQTDKELTAWAFVGTPENGYTRISKAFKVNKRNKPADYVFTPPEQTTLDELIERLDKIEQSQDPDAIKNAVDKYFEENPLLETDPTVPDWAKKPEKPEYTAKEVGALPSTTNIPSKTSELTNDSGFVNNAVTDLINYYLKSETYSKEEVKQLISAIPKFSIKPVSKLPTTDISETTIYLLSGGDGDDVYTEYIYVSGKWEILGSQKMDLTGYATETYVKDYAQPKGDYLTEVPEGYAKTEDIPTKPEDIGAQPAGDYALKSDIPSVPVQSVNGKTGAVKLSAFDVGARPDSWMPTAQEVGALPSTYTPPNQTAEQVGADPKGTAAYAVSQHNTDDDSHNDIRLELKAINDRLTAFFDSGDQTLDELSEIVAYITSNKALIDSITTSKVSVADIVNNLTTNVANRPLSAAQGVALKALIDAITIPTKLSQLTNDKGYITGYTETDPTVPAWAKEPNKPSYDKSEVGLGKVDNVKQYSASNPPPYPVSSVNGKTGAVTLNAAEVGALTEDALDGAVNNALAQAKASGEFDGADGEDGSDGITPHIGNNGNWYIGTTDTGKPSRGADGKDGTQGEQGIQGVQGEKGDTGVGISSVKQTTTSTADDGNNVITVTLTNGTTFTFTVQNGSKGSSGSNGKDGADGKTPVKGTDYWTLADKTEMVNDVLAALPTWTGGSY